MTRYIVELEPGVWIGAASEHEYRRTLVIDYAKTYGSAAWANRALRVARRDRPFARARIVRVALTLTEVAE